ncbi:hypothetical protein OSB04_016128 [Centaurea solstitialis]|uniref:NB-ARC domain-containing protein n=1 Tax=Centaurea solstitialis TaxID=347529 RepID=A0AA38TKC3_9ASTR|nr:hypothetical protein OSB04_016128 [Centaurea solstitialis]
MANADLRMFMDGLKKLIHGNHELIINKNPLILSKRPQFQLLYEELDSIIQTLFSIHEDHHHHQHHELEKVRNLKRRLKDAAEEAQDTIDLFLSAIHFRNRRPSYFQTSLNLLLSAVHFRNRRPSHFQTFFTSDVLKTSLDLEKVVKSLESIMVELMTSNIGNMKMVSSSRIGHVKSQIVAAGTSYTRYPLRINKPPEEFVVGLDRHAEIIRDKLTEDTKQLCVVSIVGMGGQGKTTLATKLFNDPFLKYHFHIRAWATVSQTYVRRDLLIQILTSIGDEEDLEKDHDSKLREKLHKKLIGRRYFIVIDDIWSIEAWDDLRLFFPHDNTASRLLLTSRLNEVALHVKPHGFVHALPCLTEKESWELLKHKVFHGDECPEWLIEPGRQIAKKCHGLPLSVVVMAGVLAEASTNKDLWENIACLVSSYIVGDQKGCLRNTSNKIYDQCKRVIWLWVAEGIIEEDGNRSLEDTAKACLMDLINRNLVIVAKRNAIGDVKACKLHDLVRELCVQKAKEEGLFSDIVFSTLEGITYEQRRIFTNQNVNILNIPHSRTRTIRSLLCFHLNIHSIIVIQRSFLLLRVLDLEECRLHVFPQGLGLLVHLRYLAVWLLSEFPNSICSLWNLQTLILQTSSFSMHLPCNIVDLVNLRHLWSNCRLYLPYIEKPMNLHSISKVVLEGGVNNFQKCFPNIKKLVLWECSKSLELLHYLENLKLIGANRCGNIAFPANLKKISFLRCELKWSDMSVIHLLPNLEVLKLDDIVSTTGTRWDVCEQQFRQLKLLKLVWLDIKQWEASSTSFPCLKQLSVWKCKDLDEIPREIGEIATLELIEIQSCSKSLVESVQRIQQEQHDVGNYELKISVDGMDLSFYMSKQGSSKSDWHSFVRLQQSYEIQDSEMQHKKQDFELLSFLETFEIVWAGLPQMEINREQFLKGEPNCGKNHIRFPATLKKLTLIQTKMANAGLQMLMDDLKKLIHGNHHPLFNNNPLILSERPQFQLLYKELDSIIQTLSSIHEYHHHQHRELGKVRDLKRRFKDAAEEAQDRIDLFLSAVTVDFNSRSDVLETSLDLEEVVKSIESIKVELITINIGNMKTDSSSRIDHVKTRSVAAAVAGTSYTRNPLGINKPMEEIVVGLDHDAEIIRDKLTEDTKQLCVVSIVGMGGQGKTTLATKVFNDPFLEYHFHIRAWATVSQTYIKRDLLIQILKSIGVQEDLEKDNDSKLREKLHKSLMDRRYLIVIDDIWSIDAWDELKLFFPHDNTASRILVTTCLNEVALHVKPHGFVHSLPCLTEEESWELLKHKVFHGEECPKWLIEPGRHIARKCHGLPLSVVVMAGVLAKEPMSKDLWEEIACSISSYHKGNLETLALSYHHLPDHLRECFLYLGGFPEDFELVVERLIWLWIAEGFIEEARYRSLEDTAKAYLVDLINKNLVIVAKRNVIGDVKACKLHDLVRELCLKKAKEERFFLKIDYLPLSSQLRPHTLYQQRRVFTNEDISIVDFTLLPAQTIRSLLWFHTGIRVIKVIPRSFVLLKVLDLQKCRLHDFPQGLALLVHLRYLAIWYSKKLSDWICKLCSLETLILQTNTFYGKSLPSNITDLVNLRHLWSNNLLYLPYSGKSMNLQSISNVMVVPGVGNLHKCFPIIRKLELRCFEDKEYHFELLPNLETLKLTGSGSGHNNIFVSL